MIQKKILLYSFLALTSIGLLSCNQAKEQPVDSNSSNDSIVNLHVFEDDFENKLQKFWNTNEFADTTRYSIVQDPLNPENKVLRIALELEDRVAKGYRSEIKVKTSLDSFGYKNKLSFKFLLPDSFYAKEEKNGRIVIQQWHNRPYPGLDWRTSIKVRPPEALYFEHTEDGDWSLILQSGLFVGKIDEVRLGKVDTIPPNVWHKFDLESYWSLYPDGYFKASFNDECFVYEEGEQCKIDGKNMYHTNPSYFKMGLYRSGSQTNNRIIYFDDFNMSTGRVHYFPPKN